MAVLITSKGINSARLITKIDTRFQPDAPRRRIYATPETSPPRGLIEFRAERRAKVRVEVRAERRRESLRSGHQLALG